MNENLNALFLKAMSELSPQKAALPPKVRRRDVCAIALSYGVIITDPENSAHPLHSETLPTASGEAFSALCASRLEDKLQEALLGSALSDLLTNEALHDWLQCAVKSLHCRAKALQLHEIQTEVLLSLSSQLYSSDSSSVQDGESVGELQTPSRTETVAVTGDAEEATRTHGGAA